MTGDRDELVAKYERLALAEAWRFLPACPAGTPPDDLEQVARLALLLAARAWRPALGEFGAYARAAVRNKLRTHCMLERRQGLRGVGDTHKEHARRRAQPRREPDDAALWGLEARREPARFPPGWLAAVAAAVPGRATRRTLLLVYRDGLTRAEAAARMGVTRQAAAARCRRAVAWLRAHCPPDLLDVEA